MPKCRPKWLSYFAFPPAMTKSSCCSTSSPAFDVVSVLDFNRSHRCVVVSHCCFNLHLSDDIWSNHFTAHRWGNNGNSDRFIFLGPKITADGDCSHEIKRCLLLGRKPMTNLDSILKSRDIMLPTKVLLVKAVVFTVVLYGCESWTIKKAESQRIDAFELWC